MKIKHKRFKKCTVVMAGQTYEISNGVLEVAEEIGKKLLEKNKNLEEIIEKEEIILGKIDEGTGTETGTSETTEGTGEGLK